MLKYLLSSCTHTQKCSCETWKKLSFEFLGDFFFSTNSFRTKKKKMANWPLQKLREDLPLAFSDLISGIVWGNYREL